MEGAKNAIIEGIEALVDRHEKIALTVRKVEQMSMDSSNYKKTVKTLLLLGSMVFEKQAAYVKREEYWKTIRTRAIIAVGVVVLLWIISMFICGGITYSSCRASGDDSSESQTTSPTGTSSISNAGFLGIF